MTMSAVLDTLNALPKELWTPLGMLAAGLLSALIAFIGVMLQNHSASERHKRELTHDTEQRRLEREAELRKLVYLEALQEFAQSSRIIRALVHAATSMDQVVDQAQQVGSSGWKLYGIAGMDTIRALTAANSEAMKAVARLAPVRMKYEVAKSTLERYGKILLEKASATTPKENEEVQSKDGENKWKGLLLQYVDRQKKMGASTIDMLLLGQNAVAKYEREVWRVIIEIRKEIGFAVDEEAFLGVMKASAEEQHQAVDSVAAEVRQFIDDIGSRFNPSAPAKPAASPEN